MPEFTEADPGQIEISITDRIHVKSNLSVGDLNLWLDRAKNMIVTGEVEQVEEDSPEA